MAHPFPELLVLGQRLAQAREAAGVSADDLARRLRLAPRQLRALEEGDHTRLPEGVYVVAMARRVAGALHADLDDAILAVRQSRLTQPALPAREAAARAGARSAAPAALPSPPAAPRTPARPAAEPPASPSELAAGWRVPLAALLATGSLAAAGLWLFQRSPERFSPASSPPVAPVPAPTAAGAPPEGASGAAPAPVAADTLRLSASEPSWMEVRTVEGRTLFEGTLSGEKRFAIGGGLEVIAGRPHAVKAAIGAGTASPLGGVADIRWKRFSPPDLRPDPPSSSAPSP